MRIDGWLPGCGGGAVSGWDGDDDDTDDCVDELADTVRDTTGDEELELAAVTTRDAGALSEVETFGMMRLADELADELAEELDEEVVEVDGSNFTVLDAVCVCAAGWAAGFAAAFGAGFLSFAMMCLVLSRLGEGLQVP
jgi:hypothetical protein